MIYKAILTRSQEVCRMLSNAMEVEKEKEAKQYPDTEINICHGKLFTDNSIPAMYHNKGYYCNVICIHTKDVDEYSLIIA